MLSLLKITEGVLSFAKSILYAVTRKYSNTWLVFEILIIEMLVIIYLFIEGSKNLLDRYLNRDIFKDEYIFNLYSDILI